mgnify:CR=1 FL=1
MSSPAVAEYQVVRSWANTDDGYIRIRATLTNGDFLEGAEYFVLQEEQIVTIDYRHHWTDHGKQALRRRWDNTPDHPELANFPHHIHVGNKGTVIAGHPYSLIDVLRLIENELSQS